MFVKWNVIFITKCFYKYIIVFTGANNKSLPNSSLVEFNNNFTYLISDIDSFLATISAILLFLLVTCMCFSLQFAERKHKYHKAITTMDKHSNSTRINYNMFLAI